MPRPNVTDQRIPQIVDAAIASFAALGLEGARMDDVAEAAGLSKAALYLYFKNKDALIQAVIERLFAPLSPALDVLNGDGSARERLQAYANVTLAAFEQMQALYPLIFELFARASRDEGARAVLQRYFALHRDTLAGAVRAGQAQGDLADVDAESFAVELLAMVEGMMLIAMVAPNVADLRAQGAAGVGRLLGSA
jgi:AcrR family transcriptional regulator